MPTPINVNHPVRLFPQPTNMTCWSAAATMLFGDRSVGPGGARLGATGGLQGSFDNMATFARAHGFRMYGPQSWMPEAFFNLIRRGPIAMGGLMPSAHFVVVGGVNGDGTATGTTLTIYDPWPPNVGNITRITYQQLMQTYPMATTYIFQR